MPGALEWGSDETGPLEFVAGGGGGGLGGGEEGGLEGAGRDVEGLEGVGEGGGEESVRCGRACERAGATLDDDVGELGVVFASGGVLCVAEEGRRTDWIGRRGSEVRRVGGGSREGRTSLGKVAVGPCGVVEGARTVVGTLWA